MDLTTVTIKLKKILIMMFKNSQDIDESIYGTINECRKHFDTGSIIRLFEGVELDADFNKNKSLVKFKEYHGNKIAYFNAVKTLFEDNHSKFNTSLLFESVGYTFQEELKNEIENLLSINDFAKLLTLHPIARQTKLFTKSKLNIWGFDVREFNSILSANEIKNCFAVIYCMTEHKLYFILPETFVYIYDIYTGELTKDLLSVKVNLVNYKQTINQNYSNNIIELESTINVDSIRESNKNVDNLFNDGAIQQLKASVIGKSQRKTIVR